MSNKHKILVWGVSAAIPAVIIILYYVQLDGLNLWFLPRVNACLNGTTFFVLIAAFLAIRKKNIVLHKRLMTMALVLSVAFLLCYVTYHASAEETRFGGQGAVKYIYYFILLTHILLSAAIVPMVLITYVRALSEQFDRHRKIARITLPLWLYVTLTGVIVYFMISPYYAN